MESLKFRLLKEGNETVTNCNRLKLLADDLSYFLVTIPIHPAFIEQTKEESIGATNGVNSLLFNGIEDLVAFTNGASNGASNGAASILEHSLHATVKEMLNAVNSWISGDELFENIGLTNQSFNRKKYLDPSLSFFQLSSYC